MIASPSAGASFNSRRSSPCRKAGGGRTWPRRKCAALSALVVDQHTSTREAVCDMLQAWDVTPTEADSGEAASRLLDQRNETGRPFSLAIVDDAIDAGQMGGLLERTRRTSPSTRLISIEERRFSGEQARAENRRGAVNASVMKPVMPSELFEAVLRAMDDKGVPAERSGEPAIAPPPTRGHLESCWSRTTRSTSGWRSTGSRSVGTMCGWRPVARRHWIGSRSAFLTWC